MTSKFMPKILTTGINNIFSCIEFGQKKSAFVYCRMEKFSSADPKPGSTVSLSSIVFLVPLKECYKYTDIDENISYEGIVNNDRVTREKIRQSWFSLYKVIFHNAVPVPVFIPTLEPLIGPENKPTP